MIRNVSAAESAGRYVPFRPYARDFGRRKPAAVWEVQRNEKTKDDSGRGLTVENWAELEKVLQGAFIFRKKNAVEQRLLEI